jgi:hypothetical protein
VFSLTLPANRDIIEQVCGTLALFDDDGDLFDEEA